MIYMQHLPDGYGNIRANMLYYGRNLIGIKGEFIVMLILNSSGINILSSRNY